MVAEAGHYRLFLELAEMYFGKDATQKRWMDYRQFEAELLLDMTLRGDRMH
jgi:tRNA-(ms[2]io[6]A)-hydroxylase